MSNYEAVIFDMGGVLIENGILIYEKEKQLEPGSLMKLIVDPKINNTWANLELGHSNFEAFRDLFIRDYEEHFHVKLDIPKTLSDWLPVVPVRRMFDVIKILKEKKFKTALITNNMYNEPGRSFLPIDTSNFDVVIESCKIGIRKPNPRIFDLCLEKLGVTAGNSIFLDDIKENLVPAKKSGFTTIHVTSTEQAISELSNILQIKF